ncbi:CoA transferase subunit A [Aminipila butyrica]|uniref:CoA transferase subunit A n=1 Tax=Aminipila butyrica TaxID=433296 RepID=A0A858BS17_9FIRM|nr:CoA transferase subunit A [Aminipila butyrica]QIB68703.1 CoA transferase subunit A [Aminipila butyrica]
MNKLVGRSEIMKLFHDNMTIMCGGFANRGSAAKLIDMAVESGVQGMYIISNDSGDPDLTVGRFIRSGQAKKITASHVGMNPELGESVLAGKMELELSPQGTLAERIRCGGAGLGGVLVTTGMGTIIEEGKQKVEVNGQTYLLETPLTAEIALVKAHKADVMGNLVYKGTQRNFNPLVAMAAKTVIVEADEIVPAGALDMDEIHTPGVFVSMIWNGEE